MSKEKHPDNPKRIEWGHYGLKPHWWFMLIHESELHSRIKKVSEKRAKELACFGGE